MSNDLLNPQQKQAVEADLGQTLVIAGAGSGKTKVLTLRYKYLIEHYHLNPEEILAITFTNKAANEMKERLSKTIENTTFNWVGTFHNICLKILRSDIDKINRNPNFSIVDDEDQTAILRDIYKILKESQNPLTKDLDVKKYPYKAIISFISKVKSNRYNKNDVLNYDNWKFLNIENQKQAKLKYEIYLNYAQELIKNDYLDFDDLLLLTNDLLQIDEVANKWSSKFKYVLIDEFQDTNNEQFDFINTIIKQHQNLFAVGDPDQMIYSWRGADISIINNFKKLYKDAKIIILNINYRSTQSILDVSNELIKNNQNRIDKQLVSFRQNQTTPKPIYFKAKNQDDESRWVVNKILELVEEDESLQYKQIAILYRSNFLSRNIENELVISNINYQIYGGVKFYQRKEIKDILAYIKLLFVGDDLSLKRILNVPKRSISPQAIDIIYNYAKLNDTSMINALYCLDEIDGLSSIAKKGISQFIELINSIDTNKSNLVDIFDEIVTKTNYYEYLKVMEETSRFKNIEELRSSILDYQQKNPNNNFVDYLQEVSLFSNQDETNADAVSLMTVHSSKGLEFDYVFIISLNEGIFPSAWNNDTESLEEERRIAYVAMTRARKRLYISSHGGTNWENLPHLPSRFINEIPKHLLDISNPKIKPLHHLDDDWFDSSQKINRENNYHNEKIDFKIGDQVIHTIYGDGIVIGVNDYTLDISFKPPYNKKTIVTNHKSLKRKVVLN